MTRQQQTPCFEPEDTMRREYYWRHIDPTVSLALTLNVGME